MLRATRHVRSREPAAAATALNNHSREEVIFTMVDSEEIEADSIKKTTVI
jgi:hypothetical protein